jgi:DNA-directed RNA polymerase subunit H (RpoH/RPB5)
MLRRAAECRHKLQILKLSDVACNKLEYRGVPKYIILNEAEIVELEERHQANRANLFPTMLCDQDAASRYLGLKPGMVVRCSPTQVRYVKSGGG